jgi:hypothetical protein
MLLRIGWILPSECKWPGSVPPPDAERVTEAVAQPVVPQEGRLDVDRASGGAVPLLVKIAGFSVQGPLNVPRLPLTVVHAPIWNCVIRRSSGCGAGPGVRSGKPL